MKVKLCDTYDSNKEAWVMVRGTVCNLYITQRQLRSAERRARMMGGSCMEVAFDEDNEAFIEAHRGEYIDVLGRDGMPVAVLKIR